MRILTWHLTNWGGNDERMGPAYYMEASYTPVAVRINAETAPRVSDARFDIKADGVTIFGNKAATHVRVLSSANPAIVNGKTVTSGHETTIDPSDTTIHLSINDESEESAEDFNTTLIEVGSWITCNVLETGEGRNLTVQLELERISDEDTEEDED